MKSRLPIVILILTLIVIYWQWFMPGVRVANDFPVVSKDVLDSSANFPYVWLEKGAEGLGEYSSFFLWGWPLNFISGVFSKIGLSFSYVERFFLLIPALVFGSIGIWKLSKTFRLSNFSKLISSIFYLVNTYIILLIDGGQLSVALAYCFFPLTFYAIEKSINGDFSKKIIAGLSITVLGFFDFRFIYILFLLCLIRFSYQFLFLDGKDRLLWFISWIKCGLVFGLILTGLNAYWLLPLVKAPISSNTFSFFTQNSFLTSGNIGHSILLLSPNWFKNVFGSITPLKFEFIFIPIIVFLATVLKPKNASIGFWVLIAVLSIFLTKGISEPFPNIYQWLFSNIPGFSLFRDSTKFFVLLALSYSLLLGVTFDEIVRKLKDLPKLKYVFFLGLIIYFLILVRPIFLNQMTGTFSKPLLENEYSILSKILENDKNFSRIFWIPHFPPLGYSSLAHPAEEASRLVQKRPFGIGTKGTYELFNFLRETPYMDEIFDISGIGYITYPPLDLRRDDMHPDNVRYYQLFSKQLSDLNWLTKINHSPINLWKTKTHQDKFFITPNVWWIIGSDNIYNEATKSAALKLSKNALIFAEENAGLGQRIDEVPDAKIVLNGKTLTDLAASFIDSSNFIFPAKNLGFEPGKNGWWKREAVDLIRWREFLQTKYGIDNQDFDLGGGWAVGEGNKKLTIDNGKWKIGDVLLARVLESSRSGSLSFSQDDNLIGQVDTKKPGNNIRWFEVGELKSRGELEIESFGDINVVNTLAVLDKNEWLNYQNKAKMLQGRTVSFDEKNAQSDNNARVSYNKINPTKYVANVSNLTQSAFLVFSQNYDGLWKLNGQTPLPVYSLLNGFKVDKDGQYLVEFSAQKYVFPGLIISELTLLILTFLLFKSQRSQ